MALPSTYSGLVSVIQEAAEDNSGEFVAFIPTAIFVAEEELAKALDMTRFKRTVNVSVTEAEGVSVATGIVDDGVFLYFNHVFHNDKKLDRVDYSYIKEINRFETSVGTSASYYAFLDKPDTLFLSPPVSSGTLEIVYTARPTKLEPGNQTNEIILNAPDALYYGTMVQMSLFMKNWETKGFWQEKYNEALTSHLNTTRRERTDVGQADRAPNVNSQSTGGNI